MWEINQISPVSLTCTCFPSLLSPSFSHLSTPPLLSLSLSLFPALWSTSLVYFMSSQARSIELHYLKIDCLLCLSIDSTVHVYERGYESLSEVKQPSRLIVRLCWFLPWHHSLSIHDQGGHFWHPRKQGCHFALQLTASNICLYFSTHGPASCHQQV